MPRNRRQPRFELQTDCDGSLQILNEVELESFVDGEFSVVSGTPLRRNELVTLNLIGETTPQRLNVRVVECKPLIGDSGIRHRVRLAVVAEPS